MPNDDETPLARCVRPTDIDPLRTGTATLLISGTRDLFLSNTVRMHRKLREAGVDADLHIFDARPHAGYGNAPEEGPVSAEIRAFVTKHLPASG